MFIEQNYVGLLFVSFVVFKNRYLIDQYVVEHIRFVNYVFCVYTLNIENFYEFVWEQLININLKLKVASLPILN